MTTGPLLSLERIHTPGNFFVYHRGILNPIEGES